MLIKDKTGKLTEQHVLMRNLKSPKQIRIRPYLTFRQKQCLFLLAEGKTAAAIALELGISVRMVREHLRNIKLRMGAISLPQAVIIAAKMGLFNKD
ncbi:MAG: helix-turn-helix transcriptional regulator [Anaerolineaceae bacterium]|nr:helix-turn-helix transcriptional regulator [Anaerolineaceae bacterium]